MFAVFVIVIAAAEVAVALAIVLTLYRLRRTPNLDEADFAQGLDDLHEARDEDAAGAGVSEVQQSLLPLLAGGGPDGGAAPGGGDRLPAHGRKDVAGRWVTVAALAVALRLCCRPAAACPAEIWSGMLVVDPLGSSSSCS